MTLETAKYTTSVSEAVPTDEALPGLSLLNQPGELVRLLSCLLSGWLGANRVILDCRVKLCRYVPGRRCVLELELNIESKESGGAERRMLIAKVYASGQGEGIYDTLQALRTRGFADGRLTVSEPLGYDPQWQLLLLDRSSGDLFRSLLLAQTDLDWAVEGAAEWLAKLHGCGIKGGRRYGLQDHLRTLGARNCALEQVSADAARLFGQILIGIQRHAQDIEERSECPVHRDFSPDHLLVDGNRFTGLDFDEFCQYDPLFDVAHFIAHVRYLGLLHLGSLHHFDSLTARFWTAYQSLAQNRSLVRLERNLSLAHLKLAQIVALVTRPPNWQPMTEILLTEAQQFSEVK